MKKNVNEMFELFCRAAEAEAARGYPGLLKCAAELKATLRPPTAAEAARPQSTDIAPLARAVERLAQVARAPHKRPSEFVRRHAELAAAIESVDLHKVPHELQTALRSAIGQYHRLNDRDFDMFMRSCSEEE